MQQPRRFYYEVQMSDGDTLFFEGCADKVEARDMANDDPDKQAKGARVRRVTRREVTAENRWSEHDLQRMAADSEEQRIEEMMHDWNYPGSYHHY